MNSKEICRELAKIVGDAHVTDEKFILMTYTRDFAISPPSWPTAVVRPKTTGEVSQILRFCNTHAIPVSPRGGGSAQEGGCLAVEGGIVLETLRMNAIIEMDKLNNTVTVESGTTFADLMDQLEKNGQKIGVAPSGAIPGTVGAHISRPGVGWGNIKYSSQGDQVLGVTVVLPDGEIVRTGTAANPNADCFYRYAQGPDLTGLFIGSEGAYGVVTEVTLRTYAFPEVIALERFTTTNLKSALNIFQFIAFHELTCYISCPVIKPDFILFDLNYEGFAEEVEARKKRVHRYIEQFDDVKFEGSQGPEGFWENRWYNTGTEFADGVAGPVNFFLPFDKLEDATYMMRQIMDSFKIEKYAQQMFVGPSCSEHVSLMFFYPNDAEAENRVREAAKKMMRVSLELGGTPYSKGRLWGEYLRENMEGTGYWTLANSIKKTLDPKGIMNPGVVGL